MYVCMYVGIRMYVCTVCMYVLCTVCMYVLYIIFLTHFPTLETVIIYVLCMYVVCFVRRFDLIYLILDKPNVDADRQLAKHLVSLYYPKEDRLEIDGSGHTVYS
jgi:cobalamin biosynthesis protein CobD/CbiB